MNTHATCITPCPCSAGQAVLQPLCRWRGNKICTQLPSMPCPVAAIPVLNSDGGCMQHSLTPARSLFCLGWLSSSHRCLWLVCFLFCFLAWSSVQSPSHTNLGRKLSQLCLLLSRNVATPRLMIHALHNIANHATSKLCVIYLDDVALQTLSCAASTAQTVDLSAVTVDRTRHARSR